MVLDTCTRRRLVGEEDRVLVALSGGPDSTALLAALCDLRRAGCLAEVSALHVDHGLRPGSARDAAPCAALCRQLEVNFRSVKVTVAVGNVQEEARRARYRALRDEAARIGATRIATGHTRSDQAESVLLSLLRGAGARGLSGIPPRRGEIVRPLVDCGRADVLRFLRGRALPWLEDPSNALPRFLRNRVRREVMPALLAVAPHAERALARCADLLRDDERALRAEGARRVLGASAAVEELLAAPVAVRRRALRRMWRNATGQARALQANHVESALGLLRRGRPGRVTLPGGWEARLTGGGPGRRLEVVASPGPLPAERPATVLLGAPGRHALPDGRVIEVAAPGPSVTWPLELRGRRPGDRFRPAGGRGGKKLKAWLIDRKVPREERDRLEVLADAAGNVLWVPAMGVRSDLPGLQVTVAHG